jgi:transposase InsO family protein
MTDQRSVFTSFRPIQPGTRAIKGIGKDNGPLYALGIGDIKIKTKTNSDDWQDGVIYEVLYVPNLGASLFSIGAATERGVKAIFDCDGVSCMKNGKVVATGTRVGKKLYLMNIKFAEQKTEERALIAKGVSLQVWHERLGHVNHATIKKMFKLNVADGFVIDENNAIHAPSPCEGCLMGKQHRLAFPTDGRNRAIRIGGLGDVCGPMPVPSLSGSRYFVTFRDDFTGYGVLHFMKCKSEVFNHLKNFAAQIKTETGHSIATFRSDNGGEYTSKELESWLKSEGIRHETSVPKTPEQNGVAERYNRTIMESMRSMLHSAKLDAALWAEATSCAVYLQKSRPLFGHGKHDTVSRLAWKKVQFISFTSFWMRRLCAYP